MANSTEIWSDEEIWSDDECQSNEYDSADTSKISALLKLYTFFLLTFQTLFRLSDTAINMLFSFFALLFGTLARTVPAIPQSFISKLPNKTCCLLFQSKWWNLHSVRLLPFLSQPIPVEGMHYSPP